MQHLKSKNVQNCIIVEIQNLYQYIIKYFGNYLISTILMLKRQICNRYLIKTLVINITIMYHILWTWQHKNHGNRFRGWSREAFEGKLCRLSCSCLRWEFVDSLRYLTVLIEFDPDGNFNETDSTMWREVRQMRALRVGQFWIYSFVTTLFNITVLNRTINRLSIPLEL